MSPVSNRGSPVREAREGVPGLVVLLSDDGRRWSAVCQPDGLTPLAPIIDDRPVLVAHGSVTVAGAEFSWAWGVVRADQPTPRVRFWSRGFRRHPALARRLSATVWAAELPGRWAHVSVRT